MAEPSRDRRPHPPHLWPPRCRRLPQHQREEQRPEPRTPMEDLRRRFTCPTRPHRIPPDQTSRPLHRGSPNPNHPSRNRAHRRPSPREASHIDRTPDRANKPRNRPQPVAPATGSQRPHPRRSPPNRGGEGPSRLRSDGLHAPLATPEGSGGTALRFRHFHKKVGWGCNGSAFLGHPMSEEAQ